MYPLALILMPYGKHSCPDGQMIDFDRVYQELVQPALTAAGMRPFRAEAGVGATELSAESFQRLLLADLVLADVTCAQAWIGYALGIRHALRAQGTLLLRAADTRAVLEQASDPSVCYGRAGAAPNPATLAADQATLAARARALPAATVGPASSPVFARLPRLGEVDWRSLRCDAATTFWARHANWWARVMQADAAGRIGDVLTLAEEAPVAAFRAEAWLRAGAALRRRGQYGFALEQLQHALVVAPQHAEALKERALCREAVDGGQAGACMAMDAPRRIYLFSGHLIDAPGRMPPRFPADREGVAAQRIAEVLERLAAGPEDLALTQGACGGDLIFTEACLARGMPVSWLQPYEEAEFIRHSVDCCGQSWHARYYAARARLAVPPLAAPTVLGPAPDDAHPTYPYERCNFWLLQSALAAGPEKVCCVCLWNGGGGDGPGGTAHMVEAVRQRAGRIEWIDTRALLPC